MTRRSPRGILHGVDLTPPAFEATRVRLAKRFGDHIDAWWRALPDILTTLVAGWTLELDEPIGRGNTSVVLRCRRADGRSAVLKLTPEPDMARAECRALRSWSASGRVPEVWAYDSRLGALLLEAIRDEVPVLDRGGGVALEHVAALVAALHETGSPQVGSGVIALAERVEFMFDHWRNRSGRREDAYDVVSPDRVARGRQLALDLCDNTGRSALLHGDLHPGNVLDGGPERGLIAIDPRPCVGDTAFDAVDWVFWPEDDPANWRHRCTGLAALLDVDAERLWDWCRTFGAMLAATTAMRGGDTVRIDALLALAP